MNPYFVGGAFIYQFVLLLVVLMAGDGQTEFRAGVYLLAVFCSLLLAASAVKSAVTKQRSGLLRWVAWPPEWDVVVAAWAVGKAFFLTILFFAVMTRGFPEWVTTVAVLTFADSHVLFTGRWLGAPEACRDCMEGE